MSLNRRQLSLHARHGHTLIELALGMPLLILLSFAAIQYGYFIYAKSVFQAAARDGTQAARLSDATNTTVQQAVQRTLQLSNFQSLGAVTATSPSNVSGLPSGTAITVTVTANWSAFGMFSLPTSMGGIDPAKQVKGAAVMNRE